MAKNYNIKTVSKALSGASSHIVIGSSVAAGMTRYVTFLRMHPLALDVNEGSRVFFCETAASGTASSTGAASAAQKMVAIIASVAAPGSKDVLLTDRPDTEHPLFTIAETRWFTAYLCSAAGYSHPVSIFAQYYDE